jgi:hypothetical protein
MVQRINVPKMLERSLVVLKTPHFIANFVSEEEDKLIDIQFWSGQVLKNFNTKVIPTPLTANEINSAESGAPGWAQPIIIYRHEEYLKTLIHEFFHRIGTDTKSQNVPEELEKEAAKLFAIKVETIKYYEAFVEATANITNVAMSAYELAYKQNQEDSSHALSEEQTGEHVAGLDQEKFKQYLNEMWVVEKHFSFFQAAKILVLSGFDNFDQFLNKHEESKHKEDRTEKIKPVINETTPAAEYHLLKALLIYNPELYFEEIIKNVSNPNLPYKIIDVLKRNKDLPEVKDLMNSLMAAIKEELQKNPENPLLKTARMTIIETR